MYYISKVKSWIKKSKYGVLIYNPEVEMISDNSAIIHVNRDMKPAILEVFEHLDGGIIKSGIINNDKMPKSKAFRDFMELRDEGDRIELVDSKLKLIDDKTEFRVLYVKETGKKVFINDIYAAMIKDFDVCELYLCRDCGSVHRAPVHVISGEEVISLIMPIVLVNPRARQLADSFEFIPLNLK